MANTWVLAALCVGLALIATSLTIWFRWLYRRLLLGTVASCVIWSRRNPEKLECNMHS
jgi:hypothetical protein